MRAPPALRALCLVALVLSATRCPAELEALAPEKISEVEGVEHLYVAQQIAVKNVTLLPERCFFSYDHFVFSKENRKPWILEPYQERLWAYLGGIVRGAAGVPHAVGGVEDPVHLLAQLSATCRICDLLRDLKSESSIWMHRVTSHPSFTW